MSITFACMSPDDYDAVRALWERTEGVGLNEGDTREGVTAFLERNQELSMVARAQDRLVGAVLCGHDGRRGYLHHLAVDATHRCQGIGTALVDRCLAGLRAAGITKCNIFLYRDNDDGALFWQRSGWDDRADLQVRQRLTASSS